MPLWGKVLVVVGGLFALLVVLLVGLIVIGTISDKRDEAAVNQAVSQFHQQLDQSDFKDIYDAADPEFRRAKTEKDFVALLEAGDAKPAAMSSPTPTASTASEIVSRLPNWDSFRHTTRTLGALPCMHPRAY